ncbi:hypothetical protein GCM10008931_43690 [Oceanobacillus oncorhynchi subsp. oncorhynchi]
MFIVYEREYKEDVWGYSQGAGIELIGEIYSVRATEDSAIEDVKNSMNKNLTYTKKIVT